MVLDAVSLDAILQEARSCFLYEDAPDYLTMLEQGMQRIVTFAANPSATNPSDLKHEYTVLMRAAHSIKGGAGIAQLPSLNKLAHKLEDLLQALDAGRVEAQTETAYELLFLGIEQIKDLVAEATNNPNSQVVTDAEVANSLPLVLALEGFLQEIAPQVETEINDEAIAINPIILKTILEVDLEECLQRVEQLLQPPVQKQVLLQGLASFVEECTLLGQTLSLDWLLDAAEALKPKLGQNDLASIATETIAQMRQLRSQTLNPPSPTPVVETTPVEPQTPATPTLNLRIPVSRLDRMNNTLGELLIGHERLSLYHSQLHQANVTLNKEAQKLNPINEQVRIFYDQLATPLAAGSAIAELETTGSEFDSLQFDQYTGFHSTLQDLQEVMVRVQETKSDIELVTRDVQAALDQLRQQLDGLRGDLTQSRLVPFKFLAQRFTAPLQNLSQRYKKPVELVIVGKETLIDQVILEQLQTPLTHLLRNAFDHGIEMPPERAQAKKSKTATINLTASVQGNQVVIAIADDGRGIDLKKVQAKAVKMGLCDSNVTLSSAEILDFLFMPGFSTAETVTDLSGRGVGLDVVRLQIERLRGKVQVETMLQQGTKFKITIPLTLSILPLLLCRCQQRTLAIPSVNILEIIALSEYCDYASRPETIIWQNKPAPLFCLTQLLPYTRADSVPAASQFNQHLGIVLDVGGEPAIVAVNSLLGERELVLKPFDSTINVPAYIAGCTVLGTGEVVAVLSPNYLGELTNRKQLPTFSHSLPETKQETATILIVDDSVAVRRLLDRVLNQSGYQVVQCRDGKEALETLNRSGDSYNLVISDIEMPRMDGFTLLREIRSHNRWHNLPVAMLTSRENDQHRQKASQLGATDYFTKPFQPADLLKAIAALL
ncbi:hybrid sensor histidine kinase/response regulator [Aliterella atlantica]|uniref:histidine kinase n=1 Tax=Aliterella atlantica CENA595 TaxID=1618023 RepID=A0A0D8ZQB4_9CYAN|nr:hybrid sensor histidine kinase/response regulator [Aliterella atlantica]KJH71008.1 hypothetical protein UH38_14530 [Aliterella atlantica CENA595]